MSRTKKAICGQLTDLNNGTIEVVFNEVLISVQDAKQHCREATAFVDAQPKPFLVDLRQVKKTNSGVRKVFASEFAVESANACAVLTTSGLSKVIGNMFLRVNKPLIPTKLFTDRQKAEAWLQQFV